MNLENIYVNPLTVTSPKGRITPGSINVLYDGGAGSWSLVRLIWDNKPRVAIRWNGRASDDKVGNPQSRGLPTWFVLPEEIAEFIVERYTTR